MNKETEEVKPVEFSPHHRDRRNTGTHMQPTQSGGTQSPQKPSETRQQKYHLAQLKL